MSITPLTLAQLLRVPSFVATEVLSAALAPALAESRAEAGTSMIATVLARTAAPLRARLAANESVPLLRPDSLRSDDPLPGKADSRTAADPELRAEYRVDIAGKPFTLPLRGSYRDGEQVRIILEPGARPSAAAANSARAPAMAADLARLPQPAGMAETLVLSADAQRLGNLLNRIESATARAALALPDATLQQPPTAGRLAQAVSQSGLFYESHLAEWALGRRSLEALRSERPAQPGALPGAAPSAGDAATERARPGEPGVVNSLLPVIKEQLNTIDSNRFTLYGLVWASQPAELTIAQEYANSSSRSERQDIQAAWTTTLKLRLPALGRVEAAMLLTDQHLRLSIATEARSDARLRAALKTLADAFEARGLALQPVRWEVLDAPV